ncbi:hypothetical protein NMG60_11007826 [Bertholletia excelsa]
MRKRNTVVVLSSSDDDREFSLNSNLSHSKSKSRRTNRRRAKKVRLSDFSASSCKESNVFEEIKLFCDDFGDGFSGFKTSTGSGGPGRKELWVDKYKPHSLEGLAVHKKKVEEVKMWLEKRLTKEKGQFSGNVLIISGPAGVGKSATVHVIASHLGAAVCEWNTPTPILWQEHLHNSRSGTSYTSKLDEFENFVERVRKYGLISFSCNGRSQTPIILLIDDLPVVNGKVAYDRLNRCLHHLVQSALVPTVILITDCSEADSPNSSTQKLEELQLSLQKAGACKVAFNPITVNAIKKTLSRLCREENCNVDAEQIDLIAQASEGDIRHAITSLQYFSVKPHLKAPLSFPSSTPSYSKGKSDSVNHLDDGFSLSFGRDETLSLFHALGKFLHNKRETESLVAMDQDAFLVKERFARLPLKMDAPEKILCKAHGQARPIADFLHENVLDFLSEEAIEDASVVTSYLSDADFLLSSISKMFTRNYETENIVQSSAASVAVRGVLFGNFHPLPSRWHTIRRPGVWQVEQSLQHNKLEMLNQRYSTCDHPSLTDPSVVATEFKPALKWLGFRDNIGVEAHSVSTKDSMLDDDCFSGTSLENDSNDTTDDEIEEW